MVLDWKRAEIEPNRMQHLRGRKETVLQGRMKEQGKRQKKH